MDTMLLVITVVSVVVAAGSAAVAWQVTHADRQRRAARVAALAAAAGVRPAAAWQAASSPDASAFRTDSPASDGVVDDTVVPDRLFAREVAGSGGAARQQWLMRGATVVAAACLGLGVTWFIGGRLTPRATAATTVPLELMALTHARADGQLSVSGLIRNPPAGAAVEKLEAEVRVFDAAGILISTRSAYVDYLELAPGQESGFAVTLGEAVTAARYRVSFRTAGAMLPHVDRRTNLPVQIHQTAEAR